MVGDAVLAIVKSAVSQGPHISLPCVALSITFLFAMFKEGCGNNTAIGFTPGGSTVQYIYTQTIHKTTQFTN
jgi:hypothetical protein